MTSGDLGSEIRIQLARLEAQLSGISAADVAVIRQTVSDHTSALKSGRDAMGKLRGWLYAALLAAVGSAFGAGIAWQSATSELRVKAIASDVTQRVIAAEAIDERISSLRAKIEALEAGQAALATGLRAVRDSCEIANAQPPRRRRR